MSEINVTRVSKSINVDHPTREIIVKRKANTVNLFNGGPRGIQGEPGPQGEQGEQGPAGAGSAVGDFLTGGTPNRLLYIDDDGNLADDLFYAKEEVLSGGGFDIPLYMLQPSDWDRATDPVAGFIDLSEVGLSKMFVINTNGANGGDGGALFITNGAGNSLIVTDNGMQVGVPLQYVNAGEAEGYVLTSDVSGNATWQPAGEGGGQNLELDRPVFEENARIHWQTGGTDNFLFGLVAGDADLVLNLQGNPTSSFRISGTTGYVAFNSGGSVTNGFETDDITITNSFNASSLRLTNVGDPTQPQDAMTLAYADSIYLQSADLTGYATENYVDTGLALKEDLIGYTPENIDNKTQTLSSSNNQYPTVGLLNTQLGLKLSLTGGTMTGSLVINRPLTTSAQYLIRFETNSLGRWYYGFYSGDGTDNFELHRGGGGGNPFIARYSDGYIEHAFGTQLTYATADRLAIIDSSKNLISATTATYPSLAELAYVKGVTSAIQTQLDTKISASSTTTLTNKRITKRVQTLTDAATITPDSDSYDSAKINEISQNFTLANPSGTKTPMQTLVIRLKSTVSRTITYGGHYRAIGVTLPTSTTAGKITYLGMTWNDDDTRWDVTAVGTEV